MGSPDEADRLYNALKPSAQGWIISTVILAAPQRKEAQIAFIGDSIRDGFSRIAYFIELQRNDVESQYLYVSMDAFAQDIGKIGVPTLASGACFQMNVASLNVYFGRTQGPPAATA